MTTPRKQTRSQTKSHYVVCVNNADYPASLETRKIYLSLPDTKAAGLKMLRVVDESGEDYLYPAELFVKIRLPQNLKDAISMAA